MLNVGLVFKKLGLFVLPLVILINCEGKFQWLSLLNDVTIYSFSFF